MVVTPTVPPAFAAALARYDAKLRCRWGVHTERWIIERRLPHRHPDWLKEKPSPWTSPRGLDLWDGWREGYVHVLSVDPELLHWTLVADTLVASDMERMGGFEAINRALDEAEAAWEAETDRAIATWSEAAAKQMHDDLQWGLGNRIATPQEPSGVVSADRMEQHEGFTVRIRKGAHA